MAIASSSLEKTLHRTTSNSSADRQRRQFVSELEDPNQVAGIPEHDFTAGAAGHGAYSFYDQDPYSHAEQYDYDHVYEAYHPNDEYPSQDEPVDDGYADLQRGNSLGGHSGQEHGIQTVQDRFPSPDDYIGRPTGSSDGP